MLQFKKRNEISDDTKLIRFVNEEIAINSIGNKNAGYSLPLNYLSYYRSCEGEQRDKSEGKSKIAFENRKNGFVTMSNEALISCWTIWDGKKSPWELETTFKDKNYVIVSTVAKVRTQLQQIIEMNNQLIREDAPRLLLINAIYGSVEYYTPNGIPKSEWEKKDNTTLGLDITTIQNIFHKPDKYEKEQECRFALILNQCRFLESNSHYIDAREFAKWMVYPIVIPPLGKPSYIDELIYRKVNGILVNNCHHQGVMMKEDNISICIS